MTKKEFLIVIYFMITCGLLLGIGFGLLLSYYKFFSYFAILFFIVPSVLVILFGFTKTGKKYKEFFTKLK
jgi:hypothetical protein